MDGVRIPLLFKDSVRLEVFTILRTLGSNFRLRLGGLNGKVGKVTKIFE